MMVVFSGALRGRGHLLDHVHLGRMRWLLLVLFITLKILLQLSPQTRLAGAGYPLPFLPAAFSTCVTAAATGRPWRWWARGRPCRGIKEGFGICRNRHGRTALSQFRPVSLRRPDAARPGRR